MQQSGRARALQYLREEVLADPDVQGSFLNEVDLAKRIGVSRTPVREALLLLVADGLVEMLPGRGAYVPPMSGREIRELMEIRALFEKHAAARTIEAGTAPVAEMRALLDEQHTIATSGDTGSADAATEFVGLDVRFHQALIDAADNVMISRSYAALRVRQRRVGVAALFRATDRQLAVCSEHERIVDALAGGDVERAGKAIDAHLDCTLQVLLRQA
ncbi:GntR family transcriptional regulator [Pseudonocardia sp. C8]|uniref:GntR family transcriptional regulator n=1 Tax=Pseudonocardia sp. C8 TaxID=2762759 RepID=UPI0016436246|nr:GntR family transcriptional regulator [Pseudonocardia sp. C8]MBC3190363.1 GntR family transcriptional regulator [Pseudonocardia sp. C8]